MLSLAWSVVFVVLVAAVGAMSVHTSTFQTLLLSKESLILLVLHAALVRLSLFAGFHAAIGIHIHYGSISFCNRKFESHVLGYSFFSGMVMMAAVGVTREHHEFYDFAFWLTMFSVWLPCHFMKRSYAVDTKTADEFFFSESRRLEELSAQKEKAAQLFTEGEIDFDEFRKMTGV